MAAVCVCLKMILGIQGMAFSDFPLGSKCMCLNSCALCSLGVTNYPRKAKKKAAREEKTAVCVISCCKAKKRREYFIAQRPATGLNPVYIFVLATCRDVLTCVMFSEGLLAGLWEFPSIQIPPEVSYGKQKEAMDGVLHEKYGLASSHLNQRRFLGEVIAMHRNLCYSSDCMCIWAFGMFPGCAYLLPHSSNLCCGDSRIILITSAWSDWWKMGDWGGVSHCSHLHGNEEGLQDAGCQRQNCSCGWFLHNLLQSLNQS